MPEQQKKKRVSKACDSCRKSKTKCDGSRPCTRCLQDNKICTFNAKKRINSLSKSKSFDSQSSNYIELLETRISLLVQGFNQILSKCDSKTPDEIIRFCKDAKLRDPNTGKFDINKVLLELTPNDNLDNLSKSNESYSISQIINVAEKPRVDSVTSGADSTSNVGSSNEDDELDDEEDEVLSNTSNSSPSNSVTSPNYPHSKLTAHSTNHVHKPQHHAHHPHNHNHNHNHNHGLAHSQSHSHSLSSVPNTLKNHIPMNSTSSFNSLSAYSSSTSLNLQNYTPSSSIQSLSTSTLNRNPNSTSSLILSPRSQQQHTYGLQGLSIANSTIPETPTIPNLDLSGDIGGVSENNFPGLRDNFNGIKIKQEYEENSFNGLESIQDSLNYITDLKWELSI